jgi:hypothetical protein
MFTLLAYLRVTVGYLKSPRGSNSSGFTISKGSVYLKYLTVDVTLKSDIH